MALSRRSSDLLQLLPLPLLLFRLRFRRRLLRTGRLAPVPYRHQAWRLCQKRPAPARSRRPERPPCHPESSVETLAPPIQPARMPELLVKTLAQPIQIARVPELLAEA